MLSKWIFLFFAVALIQSVVTESELDEEEIPEESTTVAEENVSEHQEETSTINTSFYYRLINARFGPGFTLDISRVGSQYVLKMVPISKKRYGQVWRFINVGENIYQLQNYHLKDAFSLEYVGNAKDHKLVLAKSSDSVKQHWSVVPLEKHQYKFFNENLGEEKFLTVFINTRYAYMNATSVNDMTQRWTLETVGKVDE